MSLRSQIQQRLEGLEQSNDSRNQTLKVQTEDGCLECDLVSVESIGCSFHHLKLTSSYLVNLDGPRLKRLGEELHRRIDYLLEPISIIELDADSTTAQLRSTPPQRVDNHVSYYEIDIRQGGELSLSRYQKLPGKQRQRIVSEVTREVFCRLADDLHEAAVGGMVGAGSNP